MALFSCWKYSWPMLVISSFVIFTHPYLYKMLINFGRFHQIWVRKARYIFYITNQWTLAILDSTMTESTITNNRNNNLKKAENLNILYLPSHNTSTPCKTPSYFIRIFCGKNVFICFIIYLLKHILKLFCSRKCRNLCVKLHYCKNRLE